MTPYMGSKRERVSKFIICVRENAVSECHRYRTIAHVIREYDSGNRRPFLRRLQDPYRLAAWVINHARREYAISSITVSRYSDVVMITFIASTRAGLPVQI